jgi:hypothetical protein
MKKEKSKGWRFAGFLLMESIASKLPCKIRHALFVFYKKPLVIAGDSARANWKFNSLISEASKTRWSHSEPNDELSARYEKHVSLCGHHQNEGCVLARVIQ